jgi:hypothetical protein
MSRRQASLVRPAKHQRLLCCRLRCRAGHLTAQPSYDQLIGAGHCKHTSAGLALLDGAAGGGGDGSGRRGAAHGVGQAGAGEAPDAGGGAIPGELEGARAYGRDGARGRSRDSGVLGRCHPFQGGRQGGAACDNLEHRSADAAEEQPRSRRGNGRLLPSGVLPHQGCACAAWPNLSIASIQQFAGRGSGLHPAQLWVCLCATGICMSRL